MNLTAIIVTIAIGSILAGTNILYINAILACKVETTGTFVKYNAIHGSYGTAYEPVFRYYINGEEFQGRCLNRMSLSNIEKQFAAYETYTIYVNNKKPGFFIVYRKVPIQNMIGILIGIIFLAGVCFII